VQQLLAVGVGQAPPGLVQRDAFALGELREHAPLALVAGLRPRVDGPVAQGALRVGHDERFVVLEYRAEAVARRAGAARVVEREELRRRRRHPRAVVRALEALGEAQRPAVGEDHDRVAVALAERRA
jgi:hypothetical protein